MSASSLDQSRFRLTPGQNSQEFQSQINQTKLEIFDAWAKNHLQLEREVQEIQGLGGNFGLCGANWAAP